MVDIWMISTATLLSSDAGRSNFNEKMRVDMNVDNNRSESLFNSDITHSISEIEQFQVRAERVRVVASALDQVCVAHGFASHEAYLQEVSLLSARVAKVSRGSRRPGYHGPARSATDEDLAQAAELDGAGVSLVKISEKLKLSYQTCLKWRSRKWKRKGKPGSA